MREIRTFLSQHPRIGMWVVLALGMVLILVWASRDVDLLLRQRLVMVTATVTLAGFCVWIVGWEDKKPDGNTER